MRTYAPRRRYSRRPRRRYVRRPRRLTRAKKSRKTYNKAWRPLGRTYACTLRYVETISRDPVMGTISDYIFSANGCYDPNITGTGHQPYGFDQLMTMYWHYTVVSSKIRVRMCSAQNIPFYAGIALRADANSMSLLATDQVVEQPGVNMKLMSYISSQGPQTITKTYSIKKFSNITKPMSNPDCRGDASNNPVEQSFYHVLLAPYTSTDDPSLQAYQVIIDYNVVFTEPKMFNQS